MFFKSLRPQRANIVNESNKRLLHTLILITLLALLLRLPLLTGSFWLDEAAQALESARPFSQQIEFLKLFRQPGLLIFSLFLIVSTKNHSIINCLLTLFSTSLHFFLTCKPFQLCYYLSVCL